MYDYHITKWLSVPKITNLGVEVSFDQGGCAIIVKDGRSKTIGHIIDEKLCLVNTPEYAQIAEN